MFRQSLAPVKHCAKKPLDTAGEWCAQRHWHLEFGGDGTGSKLKASNFDEVWVISIFVNLKMTVDRWVKHIEHQEIPKWNRHHIKSQQTSKHLQTNMSMDLQSHQKKGGLNTWEFSEKNQSKSYCKEVDNSVFPVYIYISALLLVLSRSEPPAWRGLWEARPSGLHAKNGRKMPQLKQVGHFLGMPALLVNVVVSGNWGSNYGHFIRENDDEPWWTIGCLGVHCFEIHHDKSMMIVRCRE